MPGLQRASHVDVERVWELAAPRDALWEWMLDPGLRLFEVNGFHESARLLDDELRRGSRVRVDHCFFGVYRQRRVAKINTLADYEIGWGELAEGGNDFFPHSQRFRIEATGSRRCRLSNRLRGRVDVPAAPLWWMPWFRVVAPRVLDAEMREIATAIGVPGRPVT